MNSNEFKRWLAARGCSFGGQKGSHLKVYYKGRQSIVPMHARKELGRGLVEAIKKQLGLKDQEDKP